MKCPKCGGEITSHGLGVKIAAHDESRIEVNVFCDICDWSGFSFVEEDNFISSDDES